MGQLVLEPLPPPPPPPPQILHLTTTKGTHVQNTVQYEYMPEFILGLNQLHHYYSADVLVTYHQNGKVGKVVALTSCNSVTFTTEFTSSSGPIPTTIYRRGVNLDLQALNALIK